MLKDIFYRNDRARDLLDAFLISAITSLLSVRFYLELTNYPQIGNGTLHIAHMLWGGLLMMAAIVISITFLGSRARQALAIIGGLGFGIFIDELGKFITEDNNYFFQPTIGLIYAIFVILYLLFNFLTRSRPLTDREYHVNALAELEEAVAHDLDPAEKKRIMGLLNKAKSNREVTAHLKQLVKQLEVTAPERPSRLHRIFRKVDKSYNRFWKRKSSDFVVKAVFSVEVIIITFVAVYTTYENIDDVKALLSGTLTYGQEVLLAQLISSLVAAGFVIYGLFQFKNSRQDAFEQFRRATIINIYLTQFFLFIRVQFEALPSLILNLLLLALISFVLRQELRLGENNDKN